MTAEPPKPLPDSAAVFACALSLWQACQETAATDEKLNLGASCGGMDGFMREVMRVANQFEEWACRHVAFEEAEEVWPYLLEDHFGQAVLGVIPADGLAMFDDNDDYLRVGILLRIPIKPDVSLRIPIDVQVENPLTGSGFREYRIQTFRNHFEDEDACPFTCEDDPFDPDFDEPYFALYGIGHDGLLEHISDRKSYADTVKLAEKLAPGIHFPAVPSSRAGRIYSPGSLMV